ncbi:hypothetical protein Syun_026932 [Stephania yunnanensis]|uniref:Uncharacterized protein n=1 Tax=Stephania yunnanensis TaxID=152371 RepID=A0AAP0EER1_9MAGN
MGSLLLTMSMLTPCLGGRLGGYSGGSELGGGYGGFGGSGLGAYRGESSLGYSILATESLPFNNTVDNLREKMADIDNHVGEETGPIEETDIFRLYSVSNQKRNPFSVSDRISDDVFRDGTRSAITGDSIVLKFEKARSALEESLKRVEDIVQQAISCQVLVIVNELRRTIFTLDPLENQVGDDVIALLQQDRNFNDGGDNNLTERRSLKKLVERARIDEDKIKEYIGSAPCSLTVPSSFEEGSRPGSNGKAFERQLSKVSSFNFRPSCRRSGQIPVPLDELKCPISLQLMYDPVIISFCHQDYSKSLVEQSKYDPFSSQSQEKMRQMMVLEQRIVENGKASVANTSLVDMQKTIMRLEAQRNEKDFELEIKSTDNRILEEQLKNKHSENKELEEKVLLLKQRIDHVMGERSMKCSSQCIAGDYLNELNMRIQSQIEKLRNLEHIKLVEENDGLHLEKQKLAEEASYAKLTLTVELRLELHGEPTLSSTSATKIYTSPDIEEIASFMKGEQLSKEVQLIRGENENFNMKAETMTIEEVKRQRSKATNVHHRGPGMSGGHVHSATEKSKGSKAMVNRTLVDG